MKYYIIAGEASGDLHGSNLVRGLYGKDPEASVRFWGGDLMQAAAPGVTLVRHYKEGAVMGVSDVLSKAGKLLGNLSFCKKDILSWNPDVVILVDYPGFNFRIARFAHRNGFKVFYYIAPKTWASRESRNRKLKAYVDRLFIVFPFEIPYFKSKGIDFTYAGNPLLDAVDGSRAMSESREDFFARNAGALGFGVQTRFIAFLAGSRKGEISRMMPVLMEAADRMHSDQRYKDFHFVIAGAPSRSQDDYLPMMGERPYVHLVQGDTYGVLRFAEAAVINSGTASLEAALIGTPQMVCWSTSALTAFVARHILKVDVKFISLGNLIIDRLAFKEFVQEDFTAGNILSELESLLEDDACRQRMLDDYSDIRKALGGRGASEAVAQSMIELLQQSRS